MAIHFIKGDLFNSSCQTIVNTVNCVGVMGAGIALEYRRRYPKMFKRYVQLCKSNQIVIGNLWIYKSDIKWVLNFPTKNHWRNPSKKEYLHLGLKKFITSYEEKGIQSIAFPILGSGKGGIPFHESLEIMTLYLDALPIHVEIYQYNTT